MSCIGVIPLAGGYIAIVDEADEKEVASHQWAIHRGSTSITAYAATRGESHSTLLMHKHIMGKAPAGLEVDHINGNGLDNRRSNLRFVTSGVNKHNSPPRRNALSPYKGVIARRNRHGAITGWMARIRKDDVKYHLGTFRTEEEAARIYDAAALRLYGPLARINFGRVEVNVLHFDTAPLHEIRGSAK